MNESSSLRKEGQIEIKQDIFWATAATASTTSTTTTTIAGIMMRMSAAGRINWLYFLLKSTVANSTARMAVHAPGRVCNRRNDPINDPSLIIYSLFLSIYPSLHWFHLSVYLSVHLSVHLSGYVSVYSAAQLIYRWFDLNIGYGNRPLDGSGFRG